MICVLCTYCSTRCYDLHSCFPQNTNVDENKVGALEIQLERALDKAVQVRDSHDAHTHPVNHTGSMSTYTYTTAFAGPVTRSLIFAPLQQASKLMGFGLGRMLTTMTFHQKNKDNKDCQRWISNLQLRYQVTMGHYRKMALTLRMMMEVQRRNDKIICIKAVERWAKRGPWNI